jgi:hypothetical protein
MDRNSWLPRICASLIWLVAAAPLWAFPEIARETKTACVACHTNPAGGAGLTGAGTKYKAEKKAAVAKAATQADYVGSAKCKMCHMAESKAWSDSAHAKAFANLKSADAKAVAEVAGKLKVDLKGAAAESASCVRCHVTGYELAGGYPEADDAKTAAVAAVGCESCHGPGSLHVTAPKADKKKFICKDVSAKMCTQCHVPALSPDFKYDEMMKKGVHPKKAS